MTGYEALRTASAWFPLQRGVIRVTGEDRARLLHALCTNHIEQLQPGQGTYALFLTAQGRVLADAHIYCVPDSLLIDTEGDLAGKLFHHIDSYIIADDVTLEDLTDNFLVLAAEGPQTQTELSEQYAIAPTDYGYVARASYTGLPGVWWYTRAAYAGLDGVPEASPEAVETVRLENARPRFGIDFSEANIAHETRLLHAIHPNKGCYLGQEIVERVRSRGHVNRQLIPLRIEARESLPPASKVQASGKDVGEVTSSAYSPALQHIVALAMLRTEALTQPLQVNGRPAAVRSSEVPKQS